MQLMVTENHEKVCQVIAQRVKRVIDEKPDAKLVLCTGGTTTPMYHILVDWYQQGLVDFSGVTTINLDEYFGLAPDHPQSYRYYMDTNFFNHINIDKARTFVADGLGDPQEAAKALDDAISRGGAPDLLLLGIGRNGHIAFNEAGTSLTAGAHVVHLDESTIEANARFFNGDELVPRQALTVGMRGIMSAKEIILMANGETKKDAINGLLCNNDITTQNPSTFLKVHSNATVVIDEGLAIAAACHSGLGFFKDFTENTVRRYTTDIVHDEAHHRFVVYNQYGTKMGLIGYKKTGDTLHANHTEVDKAFEGQGVAGRLLGALVDYARQNGYKIVPVCSYVEHVFKRSPKKYADVTAPLN